MGDTLNFIEIWIKLLDRNYELICGIYNKSIKEMFKQIPTTMTEPLSQRQKVQKLMTEIGGGCYIDKITKVLQPLSIPKQSKKTLDKEDEIKKTI